MTRAEELTQLAKDTQSAVNNAERDSASETDVMKIVADAVVKAFDILNRKEV
jgi:hypothetical protein